MLLLASACSEKEISPVSGNAKQAVEDDVQPPKSNCNGNPNCH